MATTHFMAYRHWLDETPGTMSGRYSIGEIWHGAASTVGLEL